MKFKKTQFTLFPHNKPKSWVLAHVAFVTAVLVAMPILLIGLHYDLGFIKGIGIFLFTVCGITYVCMLTIHFTKKLTGKYGSIEERDWKDQRW
jgi:NO-binding membrane sensor protein with MHYT domain